MVAAEPVVPTPGESVAPGAPASFTITGATSVAVATLGAVVLFGWTARIDALLSIKPGLIVMLPLTAATFIAAGVALWVQRREAASRFALSFARALAALVLFVGALNLVERLFGFTTGFNQLLFGKALAAYPYRPIGVIATNSGVCFTLAGFALLCLGAPRIDARWRELLALIGLGISSLALLGYFYGARPLYALDRAAGMALPTAIGFELLNLGLLLARPQIGAVALVTGRDMSSRVVRRLLISTLLVPVVSGWFWLRLREHELVSREGAIALFTIITIGVLVALVLQAGVVLRRTDAARERMLQHAQYARAEAESANRVKGEFLATMSHELRTPLNAIIGYTSLMLEGIGGDLSGQHVAQLKRIELSARHLLSLIDQILTVSRAEAGKESINFVEVAVETIVADTAAIAQPIIAERGLQFDVRVEAEATIRTDPDKTRQILLNLLSNAAKFTDRGSVVLRVYQDMAGSAYCFEVSDTGIGIAPEHQRQVFDPFWQIDMNTTRRYGGAGLGLSVSRQLAELLGGELTLASKPGVGSSFVLRLPA